MPHLLLAGILVSIMEIVPDPVSAYPQNRHNTDINYEKHRALQSGKQTVHTDRRDSILFKRFSQLPASAPALVINVTASIAAPFANI